MTALAYGIDFGTSNSAIAVAWADRPVEVLPVGRTGAVLPSLVFLDRDGTKAVGEEAVQGYLTTGNQRTACSGCALVDRFRGDVFTECRQYRAGSSCLDTRLLAQLKYDLADETFSGTHSWAQDFPLTELVAVTLRRLKRAGDRHTGRDVRRVVLGRPVRFAGTENADHARLQRLAEDRLVEAGHRAGFDDVRLLPEPQAAMAQERLDDGVLVCTDFGGGTFDVAVMDKQGDSAEVLALGGVAVGGEDFDAALFRRFLAEPLGLEEQYVTLRGESVRLPAWMRRRFASLAGLKQLLTDPSVAGILREYRAFGGGERIEGLLELLYGGQAWAAHRAVEDAKIALSEAVEAEIRLVRHPHLDITVPVTRPALEQVIADDLTRVRHCLTDTLAQAGVRPEDVDLVTRTGGSSRIPAYVGMVAGLFPAAQVAERDPFTAVVSGLAEWAVGEWSRGAAA